MIPSLSFLSSSLIRSLNSQQQQQPLASLFPLFSSSVLLFFRSSLHFFLGSFFVCSPTFILASLFSFFLSFLCFFMQQQLQQPQQNFSPLLLLFDLDLTSFLIVVCFFSIFPPHLAATQHPFSSSLHLSYRFLFISKSAQLFDLHLSSSSSSLSSLSTQQQHSTIFSLSNLSFVPRFCVSLWQFFSLIDTIFLPFLLLHLFLPLGFFCLSAPWQFTTFSSSSLSQQQQQQSEAPCPFRFLFLELDTFFLLHLQRGNSATLIHSLPSLLSFFIFVPLHSGLVSCFHFAELLISSFSVSSLLFSELFFQPSKLRCVAFYLFKFLFLLLAIFCFEFLSLKFLSFCSLPSFFFVSL